MDYSPQSAVTAAAVSRLSDSACWEYGPSVKSQTAADRTLSLNRWISTMQYNDSVDKELLT